MQVAGATADLGREFGAELEAAKREVRTELLAVRAPCSIMMSTSVRQCIDAVAVAVAAVATVLRCFHLVSH